MCSGHTGVLTAKPRAIATARASSSDPVRGGRQLRELGQLQRAGGGAQADEADQHQRRSRHREQQEPGRRAPTPLGVVGVAPPGDDEPHGDQRQLEEHEEDQQVQREEDAQRGSRDHQHEGDERLAGRQVVVDVVGGEPCAAQGREQAAHQRQHQTGAVEAEVPVDAERLDPRHVDLGRERLAG
jgi:hypothetical protein